jgi:hypothetical protein
MDVNAASLVRGECNEVEVLFNCDYAPLSYSASTPVLILTVLTLSSLTK